MWTAYITVTASIMKIASRNVDRIPSEIIMVVAQAGGCCALATSIPAVVRTTEIMPLAARRSNGMDWADGMVDRFSPRATKW